MKDISEVTACVVDSGLFLPLAHCLSEKCDRVLLWSPDMRPFPSMRQACIGDGFDNIERVRDFWPKLKEIDLFVFPDIGQGELQEHLIQACDKPVWGSRKADILERDREFFMETIEELGLDLASYQVIEGWSNLRSHLKDREDVYIKISQFRGDMETTHWRNWRLDEEWLNWLGCNFGSVKEEIRFLVFDAIETDLEIGADTFNVHGQWPSLMLHGVEGKDKCYFSAVTKRAEMPEQLTAIMDAFSPMLQRNGYANQWSMEVRVQGDKNYFIDATTRGGMPSSGSQQLIWKNFPEIIWHGAHGELIEPEPVAKFSIECMITSKCPPDSWDTVELDPELDGYARLSGCCMVNGAFGFPPDETRSGDLGWLVALGDTPGETLEKIKELADLLPDGLNADVEALAPVIKEIEEAEKEEIHFTEEQMPEPEEVL